MEIKQLVSGSLEATNKAALSHLAAGRPIYTADAAYPDYAVKIHPDGSRELVYFEESGKEVVVRPF